MLHTSDLISLSALFFTSKVCWYTIHVETSDINPTSIAFMRLNCQQNNLIDTLEIVIFFLLFLTKEELITEQDFLIKI